MINPPPNPLISRAANIKSLNRLYGNPTASPDFGVGSPAHAAKVNTLNRIYSNPTTAPLIQTQVVSHNLPVPPDAKINARAAQLESQSTRYGSNKGLARGLGFATGYFLEQAKDDAKRSAQRQARNEWLATPDGKTYQKLTNDFTDTYGGSGGLTWEKYVASLRSAAPTNLQDFAKLKAQEAYNDKLQKAIDTYQSKPENRRKIYDQGVANGSITPPEGYKSETLDRIRQNYGNERTVNDVKPYADLTPDYSKVLPDKVYHSDGTITYEAPGDHPSNIPATLVPSPEGSPIDFTQPGVNEFERTIQVEFLNILPPSVYFPPFPVQKFAVYNIPGQNPARFEIGWIGDPTHVLTGRGSWFDPATLKVTPYQGSSIKPTNRTSTSPAPQPIPTKPDGKADLKPFNASFTALNLARLEACQQQLGNQPFVFSMASVKRRALNDHLLDTFISMLDLSPTGIKSHPNYQNLRSYGVVAA